MPRRPRRIVPNTTYLVTRRVRERAFRLRPEAWLRWLFEYALGRAAEESGVEVVGFVAMCNHYHAVVHDGGARVPVFTKVLDQLLGRAVNAEQGRRDSLWEQGGPSYVALLTAEAVEDAVVYALVNPVAAGLVAGVGAWQGCVTRPVELGTARVVARPELRFFAGRSRSPLEVELRLVVPPTHAGMDTGAWRERIARRVRAREAELREGRVGEVLGMARVLAFPLEHRPATEAGGRGRAPLAKGGASEAGAALVARYYEAEQAFQAAYRQALWAYRRREAVLFPAGTYRLRVDYNVACCAWE